MAVWLDIADDDVGIWSDEGDPQFWQYYRLFDRSNTAQSLILGRSQIVRYRAYIG